MDLKLYNTLARKKEVFKPLKEGFVGLYTCGPTVYNYVHIGNLRTFILGDILKRALLINGYTVKHVMNITDVGHLTADSDTGDDKIEKEAEKEHKSAQEIARFYEDAFKNDIKELNLVLPDILPRATEHIPQQIILIQKLEEKGFTYKTSDGIYFDTSKLPDYGKLTGQNLDELRAGARVDMAEKKHPTDFALWKFSPKDQNRQMEWESPWGVGFPGWHIECSAMSMEYLGETFDIHGGGIDLILPHHSDEIAQSEAATNKPFVNYWVHGEFVNITDTAGKEEKMAKSVGNIVTLQSIKEAGFSPLDFRYSTFSTHWRKPLAFSWTALEAARNARQELEEFVAELKALSSTASANATFEQYKTAFLEAVNDDLNIPKALSVVWEFIKEYRKSSNPNPAGALEVMLYIDNILGLDWKDATREKSPEEIVELAQKREEMRKEKKWDEADKIRMEIESKGWVVEDTSTGPKLSKK
jgi:cysteinyl-tRNA synthetase